MMTFIKKIVYGLLVGATVFFGFSIAVSAECEKYEIELNTSVPWVVEDGDRCLDPKDATKDFWWLMWGMMKVFVNITVAVAFLMLVASGVMIAMWWADQWMASKWKELFKKVIIGIILIWLTWLILNTINPNFFEVS